MVEVAPLGEVEAADVCVFGDAVHREVLPPSAQVDPFPGLLRERIWLRERNKGDPGLWVSGVRLAQAPAAVLYHSEICGILWI